MKNIVIIGAGYGGVAAALNLSKRFRGRSDVLLTLIDRRNYHLYAPDLYEVASSEEELTTVQGLQKSITVPLAEIFGAASPVRIVTAEVTGVDIGSKTITAGIAKIPFDYLVMAAGSVTDYWGVPGAEKFAMPLKTLPDALAIRNRIGFVFETRKLEYSNRTIRMIVAGGGYTGCELAAELAGLAEFLCWKYGCPREQVEIMVLQAGGELIPGLSHQLSRDTWGRLRELGVRVEVQSRIVAVTEHYVELDSLQREPYDVLVWAAGVRAVKIPLVGTCDIDGKGRIEVNELLQSKSCDFIYAIGDTAAVHDSDGHVLPGTAPNAIDQGRYVAYALPLIMQNIRPKPYQARHYGFIVALGGKWAILKSGPLYWFGWCAYVIRSLVTLHYYHSIVGWWRAVKYVWLQWEEYEKND